MADVRPFRAIRYDTRHSNDVTGCIAPPYDVLSEADKQRLLDRNQDNIVAIDLPHTPPKSAGPPEAYLRSGSLLRSWLGQSILVRDSKPAVYPYQQIFEHAGRRFTRRGFIARVRAEQFRASETGIFPHEQTFSGPREDRLALTRAARCQVSPIFGMFPDPSNQVTDALYADLDDPPTMRGRLSSLIQTPRPAAPAAPGAASGRVWIEHQAWRLDRPDKIDALTSAMRDRPIFIADGHHRYTTALSYLAELAGGGKLPEGHPAGFVMFACVSMHDPGLVILPTHRVVTVRRFEPAKLAEKLAGPFDVQTTRLSCEQLEAEVLAKGGGWFGVKPADAEDGLLVHLTDAALLGGLEPDRGEAYRRLDVAVLHRYLIEEVLAPLAGDPVGVEYPHGGADAAAALASRHTDGATSFGAGGTGAAASGGGLTKVAFLLAPTPLEAVREVCLSGELMPQKSTFFYPKLATGLTLYDLAP